MKRIVRLTESDLIKLVNKVIKEDYNFNKMINPDMGNRKRRSKDPRSKYRQRTPDQYSNFLAKKQADSDMTSYYGKDSIGSWAGEVDSKYKMADDDRLEINYVDDEDIFIGGPLDEEERTQVTSYNLEDPSDREKFNADLDSADPKKVDVGDKMAQIKEIDESNPFADIPMWPGRKRK